MLNKFKVIKKDLKKNMYGEGRTLLTIGIEDIMAFKTNPDYYIFRNFIGLLDIYKEEIYEGDIVEIITDELDKEFIDSLKSLRGVVIWMPSSARYELCLFEYEPYNDKNGFLNIVDEEQSDDHPEIESRYLEIKGNAYENPELLDDEMKHSFKF
jgi:hypothetical protein